MRWIFLSVLVGAHSSEGLAELKVITRCTCHFSVGAIGFLWLTLSNDWLVQTIPFDTTVVWVPHPGLNLDQRGSKITASSPFLFL